MGVIPVRSSTLDNVAYPNVGGGTTPLALFQRGLMAWHMTMSGAESQLSSRC